MAHLLLNFFRTCLLVTRCYPIRFLPTVYHGFSVGNNILDPMLFEFLFHWLPVARLLLNFFRTCLLITGCYLIRFLPTVYHGFKCWTWNNILDPMLIGFLFRWLLGAPLIKFLLHLHINYMMLSHKISSHGISWVQSWEQHFDPMLIHFIGRHWSISY